MRGVCSAQFRFFRRPFRFFRAAQNPDCCWKYGAALGFGLGFGAAAPQSRAAGGRPRGSTRPPDSSRRQQRRQHEQQQQQMRMHKAIRATTTAPAIAHTAMETSHTPAPLGPGVPDVHEAKKLAQLHWVSAATFAQPESSVVPGGFHGKRVVHCFAHATAAKLATHAAWSSITHGSWCSARWCGSQPLAAKRALVRQSAVGSQARVGAAVSLGQRVSQFFVTRGDGKGKLREEGRKQLCCYRKNTAAVVSLSRRCIVSCHWP